MAALIESMWRLDDDPDELDTFNQQVGMSDAVLIIYGNGERKWVRKRIASAVDIADERPKKPLSGGVFECPAEGSPPVGVSADGWFVLNGRGNAALDQLEPFARKVRLRE